MIVYDGINRVDLVLDLALAVVNLVTLVYVHHLHSDVHHSPGSGV